MKRHEESKRDNMFENINSEKERIFTCREGKESLSLYVLELY